MKRLNESLTSLIIDDISRTDMQDKDLDTRNLRMAKQAKVFMGTKFTNLFDYIEFEKNNDERSKSMFNKLSIDTKNKFNAKVNDISKFLKETAMRRNTVNNNLKESSLSRILQHVQSDRTFAVISAYRGFNTGNGWELEYPELLKLPEEERDGKVKELDEKAHAELYKELREKSGFGVIEQISGYLNVKEKSFFIPMTSYKRAFEISNRYYQQSMIWKDKDFFGIIYTIDFNDKEGNHHTEHEKGIEFMRERDGNTDMISTNPEDLEYAFSQLMKANFNQRKAFQFRPKPDLLESFSILEEIPWGDVWQSMAYGQRYGLRYRDIETNALFFEKCNELREYVRTDEREHPYRLKESSLSRLVSKIMNHDCGMLTAYRGGYSTKVNKLRNEQLRAKLATYGYGITLVEGWYIENMGEEDEVKVKENVFFVEDLLDKKTLENNLRKLGEELEQDSILFIPRKGKTSKLWGTKNDEKADIPYGTYYELPVLKIGKDNNEFLTRVKGRPFYFTESAIVGETSSVSGNFGRWGASARANQLAEEIRLELINENEKQKDVITEFLESNSDELAEDVVIGMRAGLITKEPQVDYLSPLLENTFNIKQDVDMIYNRFFKEFIDTFQAGRLPQSKINEFILNKELVFGAIDSDELSSPDSIKADSKNRVRIMLGGFDRGSRYDFTDKDDKVIYISINTDALSYLVTGGKVDYLKKLQQKTIKEELTEHRVKSTIYHELSHWISDSLFNYHISDRFRALKDMGKQVVDHFKVKQVDMTYFEIDAQIHAIKNLKEMYPAEWDNWSLQDVFIKYTALTNILTKLFNKYGKEVADIWQKLLVKRMSREGLLGKNMRGFVNLKALEEQVIWNTI